MEHAPLGIHDMSFEAYHAAEGCSSAILNLIEVATPAHVRAYLDGDLAPESTPPLNFGVIFHMALLQPDLYRDQFYVRPFGMKFTSKEGRAWKDAHLDKPIVTAEEAEIIARMVNSFLSHPFAKRLVKGGETEKSIFVTDDLGTIRKSRLDLLTKGTVVPDVKTCASAALPAFERTISQYRYHVRAAFCIDNCKLLGMDKHQYMFIAIEKTPPYLVRCLQLNDDVIRWGRKVYQGSLQTYRNCLESGEWPGYSDSYDEVALPSWEMKQIMELI